MPPSPFFLCPPRRRRSRNKRDAMACSIVSAGSPGSSGSSGITGYPGFSGVTWAVVINLKRETLSIISHKKTAVTPLLWLLPLLFFILQVLYLILRMRCVCSDNRHCGLSMTACTVLAMLRCVIAASELKQGCRKRCCVLISLY